MTPEIIKRLKAEVHDEKLDELRRLLVKNVNRARGVMCTNYEAWDKALDTYRAVRTPDAHDMRARSKREPEKMIVPLSYAQVNTLVTFLFLAYTQKESIFELVASGPEDNGRKLEVCQTIIDREVRLTNYHSKLVQALLDMARFNLGVMKTSWKYESRTVRSKVEMPAIPFDLMQGLMLPMVGEMEEEREVIISDGNYVEVISPYSFFYDTRQPLNNWKQGRFAADESQFHFQELRTMERDGSLVGVEYVMPFDSKAWSVRKQGTVLRDVDPQIQRRGKNTDDYMVCLTTVQQKIVPKDYELSESEDEEIWVFTVANDNRILSADPLNAPHNEFTYDILTMSPDQHVDLSDSLSMLIDPLQEVITWLMNARIAAVRQNVDGRFVVDPNYVDIATLTAGNKYIMLKKNAPFNQGVGAFIHQLKTVDPTVTHMQDAETLMRMMQIVSGVNENSMGQVASGRRSATENRAANAGAASRMKLIAATVWIDGLAPQGRKMLLNARQDLQLETFEKIMGDTALEDWNLFHVENPVELMGNEDYFMFDGTLQSEKGYMAQSLQELVGTLASNPEVLASTNLDLVAMIKEIQYLRGLKNLERFEKPPQPMIPNGTTATIPTLEQGGIEQPPVIPGTPPQQ